MVIFAAQAEECKTGQCHGMFSQSVCSRRLLTFSSFQMSHQFSAHQMLHLRLSTSPACLMATNKSKKSQFMSAKNKGWFLKEIIFVFENFIYFYFLLDYYSILVNIIDLKAVASLD